MRVLPANGLRTPSGVNFRTLSFGVTPKIGFSLSDLCDAADCASIAFGRNAASETAEEFRRNFRRL
jgi:hypothetical protein